MKQKKLLAFLLALLMLLGGCTRYGHTAPAEETKPTAGEQGGEAFRAAPSRPDAAWINSNRVGGLPTNYEPDPKKDFYAYANADFLINAGLEEGELERGSFQEAYDLVEERKVRLLTGEISGHTDQEKLTGLVTPGLDWESRNQRSSAWLAQRLRPLQAIASLDALSDYLCSEECLYYGQSLLKLDYMLDPFGTGHYLLLIEPADFAFFGSGIPGVGRTDASGARKEADEMLRRVGYDEDEAQAMISRAVDFENKIVRLTARWNGSFANHRRVEKMQEDAPNFPIARILAVGGYDRSKIIYLEQPEWLTGLNELYTEENRQAMCDLLIIRCLLSAMPTLDKGSFDFWCEQEDYADEETSDSAFVMETAEEELSQLLDRAYAEEYCDEKMKEDIREIVTEVTDYYKTMLLTEDWLSEYTRKNAIDKLNAIRFDLVYPEQWEDWSGLRFRSAAEGGCFAEAMGEIRRYRIKMRQNLANTDVNPELWEASCTLTNAFYLPNRNTVYICAGILVGDFYREDMTDEEMFGAIGAIIAHEISHAFDSVGRNFNKDGRANYWWTRPDYDALNQRLYRVAALFDEMHPFGPGTYYAGYQVQDEAMADMGGLKCMLAIASERENFDYDSFFLAYARSYRSVYDHQILRQIAAADSHPLDYLRVNAVLMQFDEFQQTYQIREGDGMYLAPEDRVTVW